MKTLNLVILVVAVLFSNNSYALGASDALADSLSAALDNASQEKQEIVDRMEQQRISLEEPAEVAVMSISSGMGTLAVDDSSNTAFDFKNEEPAEDEVVNTNETMAEETADAAAFDFEGDDADSINE